jgi:hypothetical protein
MVNQTCNLCGKQGCNSVYGGLIRAGPFGTFSASSNNVLDCSKCRVQFLNPFPDTGNDFYETARYRKGYAKSLIELNEYFNQFDDNQASIMQQMGMNYLGGKVVGDFGCGAGFFLNLVKGVAKQTIAVEPFDHYHPTLKEKGWADTLWITTKKGNSDGEDIPC